MQAVLLESWEHLVSKEIPKSVARIGEVVIKMTYAGVCGSDITVYNGKHATAKAPVILGHEILGTIDSIGEGVENLSIGERVTVNPLISCGVCEACRKGKRHVCRSLKLIGIHENGGYAPYTKVAADMVVPISDSLPDTIAALAEPFAVGFHVLSRSGLSLGDTALVIGAGPIGMVIALTARAAGAEKVVISEPNDNRRALAEKMGFETINPIADDVQSRVMNETNGNGFDVVFETSGSKPGILLTTIACKIGGTVVPLSLSEAPAEFALGVVSFKEMRVMGSRVYPFMDFVGGVKLLERVAATADISALVSDILPLSEAQTAIDSMKNGTNTGKILLKCYE